MDIVIILLGVPILVLEIRLRLVKFFKFASSSRFYISRLNLLGDYLSFLELLWLLLLLPLFFMVVIQNYSMVAHLNLPKSVPRYRLHLAYSLIKPVVFALFEQLEGVLAWVEAWAGACPGTQPFFHTPP